jgi:hypothetical protein
MQTDVLGTPWLVYVVWIVAGACVLPGVGREPPVDVR